MDNQSGIERQPSVRKLSCEDPDFFFIQILVEGVPDDGFHMFYVNKIVIQQMFKRLSLMRLICWWLSFHRMPKNRHV